MLFHRSNTFHHKLDELPLRMLAYLGDAVCSLYEAERTLFQCTSAKQMHNKVKQQVNAGAQANSLDEIMTLLNEQELNIVRRARNLKTNNFRKSDQLLSRKATAFEALIGYLYLYDIGRLKELLNLVHGLEISL